MITKKAKEIIPRLFKNIYSDIRQQIKKCLGFIVFSMAELYQVYGGLGLGGNSSMEHFSGQEDDEEEEVQQRRSRPKQQQTAQQQYQTSATQPPAVQQPPSQQPPTQQHFTQQPKKEQFQNMYQGRESYSFFDKMSMKRSEVVKLAVFSLVIVLAIAIDRMGTHYLSKYITDNIFTNFQEFMIRLSYPVIVFLVIWIVKSL